MARKQQIISPKKENYSSDFWAKTSQIIKREDFKHPRQCQAERRWDILMTCSPYLCGFIHPRTKNFHISIEMQTIAERRWITSIVYHHIYTCRRHNHHHHYHYYHHHHHHHRIYIYIYRIRSTCVCVSQETPVYTSLALLSMFVYL